MTRDGHANSQQLRAIALASLMFLWLFAGTVAVAGSAAAEPQELTVETPDTVGTEDPFTFDVAVENAFEIQIDGDIEGFTVENYRENAADFATFPDPNELPVELEAGDTFATSDLDSEEPGEQEFFVDMIAPTDEGEYDFTVVVEGEDETEIEETVTITVDDTDDGPYLLDALEPQETTVTQGESITLTAEITNTGSDPGVTNFDAIADDEVVASDSIDIDDDETETAEIGVETADLDPGTYTHGIQTPDDSVEADGGLTIEESEDTGAEDIVVDAPEAVQPNSTFEFDVTAEEAFEVKIDGDTAGFTVEGYRATSEGDFGGDGTIPNEDELPVELAADDQLVTSDIVSEDPREQEFFVDMNATVEEGTYTFTVVADDDDETVETDVTIEVTEDADEIDQPIPEDNPVSDELFAAVDQGNDGVLQRPDISDMITGFVTEDEVNGVSIDRNEVSELITYFVTQ